jgi:archaellum component FlaG (FlaF/FlaG flagellin family)
MARRVKMSAAGIAKRLPSISVAMLLMLVYDLTALSAFAETAVADQDAAIAQSLSEMLRDARTVISTNQALINDPNGGDKHLTGQKVWDDASELYRKDTGGDPKSIDKNSRQRRLMDAMKNAIFQVMDDNQKTINEKGTGFKGFIPAVFGRLVSEAFNGLVKGEAIIKITAPLDLVRNRKALPDSWESQVIDTKLLSTDWPHGQPYSATVETGGRTAYRIAVPEYYTNTCLACHGMPKGDLDITGYPKEGRKLGDLGGVMSITLFR